MSSILNFNYTEHHELLPQFNPDDIDTTTKIIQIYLKTVNGQYFCSGFISFSIHIYYFNLPDSSKIVIRYADYNFIRNRVCIRGWLAQNRLFLGNCTFERNTCYAIVRGTAAFR